MVDKFGAIVATDNNLTDNPAFADTAGDNYQLLSASPCIDAGTPDTTGLNIGTTDLAGNARVAGSAIDMGAYEFDATLPVTLIKFTGKLQNGTADLQWQTGLEDNFTTFELQRSTDGKTYSIVAVLNAKGDNSHYTASVPQTASTAYYRLKMIKGNNLFTFSPVITLTQSGKNLLDVYPNPAKDYIKINTSYAGIAGIYNSSGILRRTITLMAGINKIDVGDLASGIYFIVSGNNKIKFIKQ